MTSLDEPQAIAVRRKPLSVALVGRLVELARADWDTDTVSRFLDERGRRTGLVPGARLTDTGHPLKSLDPDLAAAEHPGFLLEFAYHHPDADDDYSEDLLGAQFPWPDWAATPAGEGGASAFAAAWADAEAMLAATLGAPEVRFTHDTGPDGWSFAAWRVADRALVLAQGEEFGTYGELEMAAVWLVPHRASTPFPGAADFYDWLVSSSTDRPADDA
ncbi:hypothetical protein [Streptodolium elevatio]